MKENALWLMPVIHISDYNSFLDNSVVISDKKSTLYYMERFGYIIRASCTKKDNSKEIAEVQVKVS